MNTKTGKWLFVGILIITIYLFCIIIGCKMSETRGAITGVVMDDSSGVSIAGARVKADTSVLDVETVSGDDGSFSIICDAGTVNMIISAAGYSEYSNIISHEDSVMDLGEINLARLAAMVTMTKNDVINIKEKYFSGSNYYTNVETRGVIEGDFGEMASISVFFPEGTTLFTAVGDRSLQTQFYINDQSPGYGNWYYYGYSDAGEYRVRISDRAGGFAEQKEIIQSVLTAPPTISYPINNSTVDVTIPLAVQWTWPATVDIQSVAIVLGNYSAEWAYVNVAAVGVTSVNVPAGTMSTGTYYYLFIIGLDQKITAGQINALPYFTWPEDAAFMINEEYNIDIDSIVYEYLRLYT